ncbi:MAG TPA: arsenate reductase ArsC [Acidobacteriota bacterium]|nr:arsenate reductase ArsC [Acidobacteriota bacterium]
MAKRPRILFVCTGNSARSQMAEGFARYYGGKKVSAESAGLEPKDEVNRYATWVMNEAAVDIKHQSPHDISEKDLSSYDVVVTLCGDARDNCPVLPSGVRHEHWPLSDPAKFRGRSAEIRAAFRLSRNEVEKRVRRLLKDLLEK